MGQEFRADADAVMEECLRAAGFDFRRPDPRVGWSAFKAFLERPLPGLTNNGVGAEVEHVDDLNDLLWLVFFRQVETSDVGWRVGCAFSRVVPESMWAIGESLWWWEDEPLADWFSQVEALPGFAACLRLTGWKWEGFSA